MGLDLYIHVIYFVAYYITYNTLCEFGFHHQYTLETYGESRSTGTQFRPYRGGPVDGPENGPAPPPWVIPCTPDNLFQNQVKKIEVPHTSVVRVRK